MLRSKFGLLVDSAPPRCGPVAHGGRPFLRGRYPPLRRLRFQRRRFPEIKSIGPYIANKFIILIAGCPTMGTIPPLTHIKRPILFGIVSFAALDGVSKARILAPVNADRYFGRPGAVGNLPRSDTRESRFGPNQIPTRSYRPINLFCQPQDWVGPVPALLRFRKLP